MTPHILVTGANGQLAHELRNLEKNYPQYCFHFLRREDLPIEDDRRVREFFHQYRPSFLINCAAYTAVDRAETEREKAMLINAEAVELLATASKEFGTKLIHISTDYVFDGLGTRPYIETDITNPVNYYGVTKLLGEEKCLAANPDAIVLRTSWVYSVYGNNFVKTMIRLMGERPELKVVRDQFGSPTAAADLGRLIMEIVSFHSEGLWIPGIFHYSNEGIISWFEFAQAIKSHIQSNCRLIPIDTAGYPTLAKRPAYSVLCKDKIRREYGVDVPRWEESLAKVMASIKIK